MTTAFSSEACRKRNRVAVRRDGMDAAPVRLLATPPPPSPLEVEGCRLVGEHGALPQTPEQALEAINALRGESAKPLSLEDVYLHYAEAGNGNFIRKYFMFLDGTTLRNMAEDARRGIAFMNSHRTGGLSRPSELPFGRTFAGRYEEYLGPDGPVQRTVVGIYMLRGVRPNGESGPTTDELHALIEAGTLFDVSVGLFGGERVCDVCGNELGLLDAEGGYRCAHVPGTARKMSEAEREAQLGRGVPKGFASYRLVEARTGEVSAVFDGALPGAGFRKALSLSRDGLLEEGELLQARDAYCHLLSEGDFAVDPSPGRSAERSEEQPDEEDLAEEEAAEVERLRAELAQVREENAELREADERRELLEAVNGISFLEGRHVLSAHSQKALVEALVRLPKSARGGVMEAVEGLQLVELGERGFQTAETGEDATTTRLRQKAREVAGAAHGREKRG